MVMRLVKEPAVQVKLVSLLQVFAASQAVICLFKAAIGRNYLLLNWHTDLLSGFYVCLSVSPPLSKSNPLHVDVFSLYLPHNIRDC